MSSETSNGYLNDAEAWHTVEEEPDSPSTHDMSMSATVDTVSQRSLLLSHTEALAGTRTQPSSSLIQPNTHVSHLCKPKAASAVT